MNIIECTDKDGIKVVCDDGTWYNHIEAEHPEMKECAAIVKETIQDPYEIYQDRFNLNKKVIYKPFVLPRPFHTYYLRIVIEYKTRKLRGGLIGYVRTAFACSNKKKGDVLLWVKPS
ncbi:MAG TPA: hypothetical protein G4O15_02615 [Dehalococcoidia bacterium]|nr:hypothetical protein [Dehalococcoidia bacterium]